MKLHLNATLTRKAISRPDASETAEAMKLWGQAYEAGEPWASELKTYLEDAGLYTHPIGAWPWEIQWAFIKAVETKDTELRTKYLS
jgi:hypothetical protein